jgi:hypothetical protein
MLYVWTTLVYFETWTTGLQDFAKPMRKSPAFHAAFVGHNTPDVDSYLAYMIDLHTDHCNMKMYESVFYGLRVVGLKLLHDLT